MMSVIDQFYQDFNIINNTVNSYSTAKPTPLERRMSALESKDYKKRFGLPVAKIGSQAESQTSATTNFDRDGYGQQLLRSNTYNKLPESRRMDFGHSQYAQRYGFKIL